MLPSSSKAAADFNKLFASKEGGNPRLCISTASSRESKERRFREKIVDLSGRYLPQVVDLFLCIRQRWPVFVERFSIFYRTGLPNPFDVLFNFGKIGF